MFDSLEIDKTIMAIIYHITNLVCYVEYNNYEYLNTTHARNLTQVCVCVGGG